MPAVAMKQRSVLSALTIASRWPPGGSLGGKNVLGVGVEASPVDGVHARRAPMVVQVGPEARLAGRVHPVEPVEADAQAAEPVLRRLGVRRLHARDERIAGARVGPVG